MSGTRNFAGSDKRGRASSGLSCKTRKSQARASCTKIVSSDSATYSRCVSTSYHVHNAEIAAHRLQSQGSSAKIVGPQGKKHEFSYSIDFIGRKQTTPNLQSRLGFMVAVTCIHIQKLNQHLPTNIHPQSPPEEPEKTESNTSI